MDGQDTHEERQSPLPSQNEDSGNKNDRMEDYPPVEFDGMIIARYTEDIQDLIIIPTVILEEV